MTTDDELLRMLTLAVQAADVDFERDSDDAQPRHYVRDYLLVALNKHGLALVREHDGRDAKRMKWLVDYMVEIEYEPTPDEDVHIWLLMNKGLRRERYETSDLRAAIDAAIAREKE